MKKILLVTIAMATAATLATASMSNNLMEDDTSAQQWTAQTIVTSEATSEVVESNLDLVNSIDSATEGYMKSW